MHAPSVNRQLCVSCQTPSGCKYVDVQKSLDIEEDSCFTVTSQSDSTILKNEHAVFVSQCSFPDEGPLKDVLHCHKHVHDGMTAKDIKAPWAPSLLNMCRANQCRRPQADCSPCRQPSGSPRLPSRTFPVCCQHHWRSVTCIGMPFRALLCARETLPLLL